MADFKSLLPAPRWGEPARPKRARPELVKLLAAVPSSWSASPIARLGDDVPHTDVWLLSGPGSSGGTVCSDRSFPLDAVSEATLPTPHHGSGHAGGRSDTGSDTARSDTARSFAAESGLRASLGSLWPEKQLRVVYFEATIVDVTSTGGATAAPPRIAVGLAPLPTMLSSSARYWPRVLPGGVGGSVGYSSDGRLSSPDDGGMEKAEPWGRLDTVGCGVEVPWATAAATDEGGAAPRTVFFTLNGVRVPHSFVASDEPLFPAVGIGNAGKKAADCSAQVRANFGRSPFVWKSDP